MARQHSLSRRQLFARLGSHVLAATALAKSAPPSAAGEHSDEAIPISGEARAEYAAFDQLLTSFLQEHDVPGAGLAVGRNGQLVFSRGYGYADRESKAVVQPESRFRIASVSKPITAVAILKLVEDGKLTLDEPAIPRMNLAPPLAANALRDTRAGEITVRHCLNHTAGWDRDKSGDPIGKLELIGRRLGFGFPVKPEHVVRYALSQPLDSAPGERYAYSNVGYLVLGRIIEAVSGQTYEDFVQSAIFDPLGITSMTLGRAMPEYRAKDEVTYYDREHRTGRCVFPPRVGENVPIQYGVNNVDGYEAHGGWIATASDLIRFAAAFDDPNTCPILKPDSIRTMWDRPAGLAGHDADGAPLPAWYALGWNVRSFPNGDGVNTWHGGWIIGTESILIRRRDGFSFAVVFNTSNSKNGERLSGLIDPELHRAAGEAKRK